MKKRPIIGVVIISVLIGAGIFLMTRESKEVKLFGTQVLKEVPKEIGQDVMDDGDWYPTVTPRPPLPALNKDSNLVEETKKLDPKDYSEDFEIIREQI